MRQVGPQSLVRPGAVGKGLDTGRRPGRPAARGGRAGRAPGGMTRALFDCVVLVLMSQSLGVFCPKEAASLVP